MVYLVVWQCAFLPFPAFHLYCQHTHERYNLTLCWIFILRCMEDVWVHAKTVELHVWLLKFAWHMWFVWMRFTLISVCILISIISVVTHVLKWPAEFMPCQGPCAYESSVTGDDAASVLSFELNGMVWVFAQIGHTVFKGVVYSDSMLYYYLWLLHVCASEQWMYFWSSDFWHDCFFFFQGVSVVLLFHVFLNIAKHECFFCKWQPPKAACIVWGKGGPCACLLILFTMV